MSKQKVTGKGMTARKLIAMLATDVGDLDLEIVNDDGEQFVAVTEIFWSPNEMALAGRDLKGRVVLHTKSKRREK